MTRPAEGRLRLSADRIDRARVAARPQPESVVSKEQEIVAKTRIPGQALFVIGSLVLSLSLLSQLWSETPWIEPRGEEEAWGQRVKDLVSQPRFWPAIGLGLMVFGFAVHWLRMRRRRPNRADAVEARLWLGPIEYAAWFMAYVFVTPVLGFLPTTLLFAPALTWRCGYRARRFMLGALGVGAASVVVFKSLLGVNIPGGEIYQFLPGGLRNFFITYL